MYIARESATQDPSHAGFDHAGRDVDVAETLRGWQESGDERLWKIIISPEFGDRLDLERLTRDIIKQAKRDLGTPLEWVAVTHFNTKHPHVHLVVRGRRTDVAALTLPVSDIKTDERIVLFDQQSGLPVKNRAYRAILDDGQEIQGRTDADGRTELMQSAAMGQVQIIIEPHDDAA